MSQNDIQWPELIRDFRVTKGLKQEAAAQILGVSQATLSRWECGETVPTVALQSRLFKILRNVRSPLDTLHWVETFRQLRFHGHISTAGQELVAVTEGFLENVKAPRTEFEGRQVGDLFGGEVPEMADRIRREPAFTGGVIRYEGCFYVLINPDIRKNCGFYCHHIAWPHFLDDGEIVMVGQGTYSISRQEAREIRERLGGPIKFTYLS